MVLLWVLGILLAAFLMYVLFLTVCALLVNPRKEYTDNSPFYRFLLDSATAMAMKVLRIRVHVTGIEKLPKGEKLLFVCNHRSNFDPIVTWYVLRDWKLAFVSKGENFQIPIFGRIIRKCCFMSIDRQDPRKAIQTIYRGAELLQRQEVSVGVYPEGTRSKDGQLLPLHNGVFKMAQRAEAAVAVLTVRGTEQIHRRTPFQPTDVYLDVLEVLPAASIRQTGTEMIGAAVRRLMQTNLEREKV